MQTGVKQVFYFNASSNSLGGFVEDPFRYIPTPCSVALSPAGGNVAAQALGFGFERVVSCRRAYTLAAGRPVQMNGAWIHRVVSVVEGFSLLGRLTADRLTAQVFVTQPSAGGGPRKISFTGTRYENLRMDGKQLTPTLNLSLMPARERSVDAYDPSADFDPTLQWPSLWPISYRQISGMLQSRSAPSWIHDRFSWVSAGKNPEQTNPAGHTICSVVDKIDGLKPGSTAGHCFELPDLGRVMLGEVVVHPDSASLTMIRAELGCKVRGQVSAASIVSNGTTCPPS